MKFLVLAVIILAALVAYNWKARRLRQPKG
jgi:hypothetical protein